MTKEQLYDLILNTLEPVLDVELYTWDDREEIIINISDNKRFVLSVKEE